MKAFSFLPAVFLICFMSFASTGCTVVSIVDAAASTAVDVAVGAVKVTGKAVGAVVDVVTPDKD
jgi:hypothetical protein